MKQTVFTFPFSHRRCAVVHVRCIEDKPSQAATEGFHKNPDNEINCLKQTIVPFSVITDSLTIICMKFYITCL